MPKYKLKFQKSYQPIGGKIGVWQEVSDAELFSVLLNLKDKYDFEIVSIKFRDCFNESYIKVKCSKDDRYRIFSEFCIKLGNQIWSVEYY